MNSFDRTLLAKLGFGDPDKKNNRHDLACQYLADPRRLLDLPMDNVPSWAVDALFTDVHMETHIMKGEGQYATTIGFADVTATLVLLPDPAVCRHCGLWFEPGQKCDTRSAAALRCYMQYYDHCKHCGNKQPSDICSTQLKKFNRSTTHESPSYRPDICLHCKGIFRQGEDCPVLVDRHAEEFRKRCEARESGPPSPVLVEVKISPVGVGDIIRQLILYRTYRYFAACWVVTDFSLTDGDVAALSREGIQYARLGESFEEFVKTRSAVASPHTI